MARNKEDNFIIQSEIENLKDVEIFMLNFCKNLDLSKSFFNRIFLCISEAVSNCIIHGNSNDPKKKVAIRAKLDDKQLMITIEDEGKGFNFLVQNNPTNKRNIRKEFGRGLFIIRAYADFVRFYDKGKIITLGFEIGDEVNSLL